MPEYQYTRIVGKVEGFQQYFVFLQVHLVLYPLVITYLQHH